MPPPGWTGGPPPGYPPEPGGWAPPQAPAGPTHAGQPPYQGSPGPSSLHPPGYGPGTPPPARPELPAGPPEPPTVRRRRKGSILPALFFGLLAIILGGIAVYLFLEERESTGPVAPTALPAENQFIQVETALEDAGLSADAQRQNSASYPLFPGRVPGQAISIEGHDAWIYIFTGPTRVEDQEAAAAAFSADEAPPPVTTASGTDLTAGPPRLFGHSNVILLLSMDDAPDDQVLERVERAIMSLP